MSAQVLRGDCLEVLRGMADNSVDAIVTDPPYGLSFMGAKWDHAVPSADVWREALRVLKPGGHIVAFFGARTYHRGAVAIEDAGFEIRDQLMYVFGSGFPKSLNVAIAIDKQSGAMGHRGKRVSVAGNRAQGEDIPHATTMQAHEPITEAAREWSGWGTNLKPAHEPIVLARKPLSGNVAANVLERGTGAINVDGCRVTAAGEVLSAPKSDPLKRRGVVGMATQATGDKDRNAAAQALSIARTNALGRWPANVVHDGSDEVLEHFPESKSGANPTRRSGVGYGSSAKGQDACEAPRAAESGSAARFFYCAKASRKERGEGNNHPTVKPVALMRWLVRLITPPGGLILDPFAGSGSTGVAAVAEGFNFTGIEREDAYAAIAEARIAEAVRNREEIAQPPDSTTVPARYEDAARQARIPGT